MQAGFPGFMNKNIVNKLTTNENAFTAIVSVIIALLFFDVSTNAAITLVSRAAASCYMLTV
jgi:hypothetical protein